MNPIVTELDAKRLGYYYDFDHAVVLGARDSWQVTLRLASPRLKMVAMKDFNWVKSASGWQTEACPLGKGAVNWDKAFAALAEYKYAGPISIHQEYKAADRLAAAHQDLEFAMRHMQAAKRKRSLRSVTPADPLPRAACRQCPPPPPRSGKVCGGR